MPPVAILAGGLATRMRPITEKIPKALIDVAGKPFVARQLEYLARQKVSSVVLCVGYLGEMIRDEIGDGARFGLKVSYSFDGEKLLGTGGALRRALPLLGDVFFVLYGDSFLPVEFAEIAESFRACGQPALMTVLENAGRWDRSNVLMRDGRLVEYNKAAARPDFTFIDYGLGLLKAEALQAGPDDAVLDLAEIYHRLSLGGQLAAYTVKERFYEIGSPEGLAETIHYFKGTDAT
ncbi:nucleotidyl transferase [Rhodoblastus sphagnicola]|uniref:Nucleotidyl transferase n=1 Tax=Rhodoblastus sphagnicola TaxID=333368 RepID=A0A2S6NDC5_9HYPH|nr:nucleotidyl transferase [Rhodoblastus sphagnicola]